MNTFQSRLCQLVLAGGGEIVRDIYVTRPGCLLWSVTQPTSEALDLMTQMHIDSSQPDNVQLAEFDARIKYLGFPKKPKDGYAFVEGVLGKGCDSIYGRQFVTMMVAGITLETSLELVSHPSSRVARLLSSDTRAMDECLYRISARDAHEERLAIERWVWQRGNGSFRILARPIRNRMNTSARVTAMTIGMTLHEWNLVLGSRLRRESNEPEVTEIMVRICEILHEHYPLIIKMPATYRDEDA